MSIRDLKNLLSESLELENELIDFIKECLTELFPEDAHYLNHQFEEDIVYGRAHNGCIQSLDYYRNMANENKKHREARKLKELDK